MMRNNTIQRIQRRLTDNQKGVCLALTSTALFTLVGVIVRILSTDIDPFQILFFRQLVFVVLLLPSIYQNMPLLLNPKCKGLHAIRVSGAFVALYGGFLTVSHIPFADATALGFIQVLFVAALSRVFLFESLTKARLFTIVLGFIGVMFVVQPSFESTHGLYLFSGVMAAFGASVAVLCIRKVAQIEPKITLLAYQAIFVGLLSFVPALYAWQWPNLTQLSLLVCVGAISSCAQWIGVSAYKYGEANIVSNVEYSKIIYSLMIGFYLFSEVPNHYAIAGALLLIVSAVLPYLYQQRMARGRNKPKR